MNNNRTLIIEFSIVAKIYLMKQTLLQEQEPVSIITKSLNQYPNIKAQTSDEVQLLSEYENSNIVFDNMLLSKQVSKIDLFFTKGRHNSIDIYYISQSWFHLSNKTIRKNSNLVFLFEKTLTDLILLFHDIAGLDMNLEEWKQLCRNGWESDYDYLQMERFSEIGEGRYTVKIVLKLLL